MMVWVNGRLADESTACISPFDHGLLTGDGVFETLRVYDGRAFAVRRHLERLERSARGLGLPVPDRETVRTAMESVVEANQILDGRVRVTLTGGTAPLGSDRGDEGTTLIVAAGLMRPWPVTTDVVTVPWPRNERGAVAGLKTISYGENVVALARARAHGAGEAIFGNLLGNLCEGTGTNVFLVHAGRLITPPLSSGCLAGVTRDLLLEVTDAVEADVPLSALADAGEAFLTSSTREVQAIGGVDGRRLDIAPGPQTTAASTAFAELLARDFDP